MWGGALLGAVYLIWIWKRWMVLVASLLLLAMLGAGRGADVLGHGLGLVAGGVLGLAAGATFRRPLGPAVQWSLIALAALAVVGCWRLALARREPGRLSFASSGAGSSTHMSGELFKSLTNIDILHIPYKGSGQAMPDLISGRVSMMFENMPGAVSHIRAGKVRALAVTGLQHSSAMPELPTVAEAGVPGYESLSWSGIAVAAGTPRALLERLNRDINSILATPEMRQKLAEQGADAMGGSPEAFAAHVRAEREKWSRLIRENNIVVN